jgi:iron complex outermembrane receptor protein
MPSYGLVNARLQWNAPGGRTTVSLFANNLLDKTYATYATRFGGGYWDSGSGAGVAAPLRSARSAVRGRPREYGITVQYNFE